MAAMRASRRRTSSSTRRNTLIGLAFCAPWIVGLLAFRAYPIVAALWYSFTDYHGMMAPNFIGIQNYLGLFQDPDVGGSVANTLIYTAMAIPAGIVTALGLAIVVNTKMRG